MTRSVTIVLASDAYYFDLLKGLIHSIKDKPEAADVDISLLDVGLTSAQKEWAANSVSTVVEPGWDFETPWKQSTPGHFRALLSRPFFPRYFPGYEIYVQIDTDAWVQRWEAIELYINAARKGRLAITPQIDRAYSPFYKRPRRYWKTQNFDAFNWSYGWKVADRLARNPILNAGVFALRGDAPHWAAWANAIERALSRKTLLPRKGWPHLPYKLVEQTALNYVVFGDKLPAAFLPAWCNWMCGLAVPMVDDEKGLLVEPNEPFHPLGVVHFAGAGIESRPYRLETINGGALEVMVRYENAPFYLPGEK